MSARVSDGSSADGCGFVDSYPDFGHVADEVVAHRYKRGYLEVVQLSLALGRNVSTSGSPLRLADAVLKHETLEPGYSALSRTQAPRSKCSPVWT